MPVAIGDVRLRESNPALAHQLMTPLGEPGFWDLADDDFVIEFPCAPSVGKNNRHVGKTDD
ncbi:MAG: hypothetical protein ABSB09_01880 [Acidimicrobiales bacterium]